MFTENLFLPSKHIISVDDTDSGTDAVSTVAVNTFIVALAVRT